MNPMLEISTIAFMIIILGVTWGAFGFLVSLAYRKEKQKAKSGMK
jgi:hypothetical protein